MGITIRERVSKDVGHKFAVIVAVVKRQDAQPLGDAMKAAATAAERMTKTRSGKTKTVAVKKTVPPAPFVSLLPPTRATETLKVTLTATGLT